MYFSAISSISRTAADVTIISLESSVFESGKLRKCTTFSNISLDDEGILSLVYDTE